MVVLEICPKVLDVSGCRGVAERRVVQHVEGLKPSSQIILSLTGKDAGIWASFWEGHGAVDSVSFQIAEGAQSDRIWQCLIAAECMMFRYSRCGKRRGCVSTV